MGAGEDQPQSLNLSQHSHYLASRVSFMRDHKLIVMPTVLRLVQQPRGEPTATLSSERALAVLALL